MTIDLVIFDCDGVLVDSEEITHREITAALRAVGVPLGERETLERFMGGRLGAVLDEAAAAYGATLPADFLDGVRARIDAALAAEVEAIDGVAAALAAIPYPTCVASNGPHSKMRATLGRTGLLPRFAGRVFSAYDRGVFKPEPGLFLHAAEALAARPAHCVVVEDSDIGLEAARRAGMRALAFPSHGRPLEAPPAEVLPRMRDLPARLSLLDAG